MEQKSLWNKDFLLDTGINFVVYLIYYLLMVIIAVVAKDQLNASLSEAGLRRASLSSARCWRACSSARPSSCIRAAAPCMEEFYFT